MEIMFKERSMDMVDSPTLPEKCTTVVGQTVSNRATAPCSTNQASSSRRVTGSTALLMNDHMNNNKLKMD